MGVLGAAELEGWETRHNSSRRDTSFILDDTLLIFNQIIL